MSEGIQVEVKQEPVAALGPRWIARVNGVRIGSAGSKPGIEAILHDHLRARDDTEWCQHTDPHDPHEMPWHGTWCRGVTQRKRVTP